MHDIEPYYNWRHLYISENDELSPYYGKIYDEIYFTNTVYNYYIHPQWDEFGSNTLYLKLLFIDYDKNAAIIEFIGEWNDCLYNDIMFLKRNIIEFLINNGINKFILIGENVLNFHYSDNLYYEEWFEDIEDGWITCIGFHKYIVKEFFTARINNYLIFDDEIMNLPWRTYNPDDLITKVNFIITKKA